MPLRGTLFGIVVAGLGLSSQGCETYEVPASPPPPPVTVNLYAAPAEPVVIAAGGPRPEPPTGPPSSGIAACDAYFARTSRCARQVTADTAALAHFDHSLEIARREDRIIAQSGDEQAREKLEARCKAALAAYEGAPCGR